MTECSYDGCNFRVTIRTLWLEHLRNSHNQSEKSKNHIKCCKCSSYCNYVSLRRHLSIKHPELSNIKNESESPEADSALLLAEKTKKISLGDNFPLKLCEISSNIYDKQGNKQLENYFIADVPSDGSCLFWAAAFAYLIPVVQTIVLFENRLNILFNTADVEKWMSKIKNLLKGDDCYLDTKMLSDITNFRCKVVDYMKNEPDSFKPFIVRNFDTYLESMKDPTTCGDEPELEAIAAMIPCNVYVYRDEEQKLMKYGKTEDDPTITLFYTGNSHYKFGINKHLLQRLFYLYKTTGLKTSLHGDVYQLKLLVLFLKRGLQNHRNFCLATEIRAGEKFDDLLYVHTDEHGLEVVEDDGKIHFRFLQAKHAQVERKITYLELTKKTDSKKDDFCLAKYFKSYKDIKKNPKYRGYSLDKFYISTNIQMDLTTTTTPDTFYIEDKSNQQTDAGRAKIAVKLLQDEDVFFNAEKLKGTVSRYKLQNDENLFNIIKSVATMELLAIEIVKHFTKEIKKFDRNPHSYFGRFERVLFIENILEVVENDNSKSSKKKDKNFCIKLKNIFTNIGEVRNHRLSADGKKFKEHFSKEYAKIKKVKVDEINWVELSSVKVDTSRPVGNTWIEFNITDEENNDGVEEHNHRNAEENEFYLPLTDKEEKEEVEAFFNLLVFAITPDEVELGNIISNELGEQFNLMDSDFVASQTLISVLDWMKRRDGRYFHDFEVKKLFTQIDEKIAKMKMAGITQEYCRNIQNRVMATGKFEKENVEEFLKSETLQIYFESANLTTVKGILEILKNTYKEIDKFIFISIATALSMEKETFLITQAEKSNDILVFYDDDDDQTEIKDAVKFCKEIINIVEKIKTKKCLFLTNRNIQQNKIKEGGDALTLPIKNEKMDDVAE